MIRGSLRLVALAHWIPSEGDGGWGYSTPRALPPALEAAYVSGSVPEEGSMAVSEASAFTPLRVYKDA
ncbi:MAG: hypothetical protein ACK41P_10685, partial [Asticcacaulis sp.]